MKRNFWFFLLMLLVLIGLSVCTKEEPPPAKEEPAAKSANEELPHLPVVVTDTVVIIPTPKEVMLGFEITDIGGAPITAKGVCWSTSQNPTTDNNKVEAGGVFLVVSHCHIGGLKKSTTYYVRAYAANSVGTGYGNQVSFTTPASIPPIAFNPNLTYGSVEDIDGNIYKTIQIGIQTWFAENLKTTRYNDGVQIFPGTGGPAGYTEWFDLGMGAYCWYDNDAETFKDAYGALYNWHTVGTRKLCPIGWHVPTDLEWTLLTDLLGGEEAALSKLSEDGTNESGFTAISVGSLTGWGFTLGGCIFWSATSILENNFPYAILRSFWVDEVIRAWEPQSYSYSVRCLKD